MKTYKCIEMIDFKKRIGTQEIDLIPKIKATSLDGKTYRFGVGCLYHKSQPYKHDFDKLYILLDNGFCVPYGIVRNAEKTVRLIQSSNITELFEKLAEGLEL